MAAPSVNSTVPVPDAENETELGYSLPAGFFLTFNGNAIWNLREPRPADIDTMLDRDGKASGLEQVLTLPLRKAPITVTPAKGDTGGAELMQGVLDGMSTPLQTVHAQMCSAVAYRAAFFEKVFTLDGGQIGLKKLAFRPAATCTQKVTDVNGSFDGFEQLQRNGSVKPIRIPTQRALVYVHGSHLRPIFGRSDLEVAYWVYKAKEKIRYSWYRWLEFAAEPRTTVKHADPSIAQKIVRTLARLKSGGIAPIDAKAELDQIPITPQAAIAYKDAMAWLDAEASQSVLATFTDLATNAASGTGSYALSKDQTDFFLMSRQAVADEMSATWKTYVAADLVGWNLGPDSPVPNITVGPVGEADVVAALSLLETLVGTGSLELPQTFVEGVIGEVSRNMGMNASDVVNDYRAASKAGEVAVNQQGGDSHTGKIVGAALGTQAVNRQVSTAIRREAPHIGSRLGE